MSGSENIPGAKQQQDAGGEGGQPQGDVSVQARARRMGWHPLEQFRGNKSEWVDAEEFVRRGEAQLPILRENLRKSDSRAARLEVEVRNNNASIQQMQTQLDEARQAVVDIRELLSTAETRSYQRAINDINNRMEQAIEAGDKEGARAARADLQTVTTEMQKRAEKKAATEAEGDKGKSPAAPKTTVHPTADAWVRDDSQRWYRENVDAKGWADGRFDRMNADPKTKNLTMGEKLEIIRTEAGKKFPEYFDPDDPAIDPPPADDDPPRGQQRTEPTDDGEPPVRRSKVTTPRSPTGGGGGGGNGKGRSFDDMPQDAKDQFKRVSGQIDAHIKQTGRGTPLTKERFALDYFGPVEE